MFSVKYCAPNAGNRISKALVSKFFCVSIPPDPPGCSRLQRSEAPTVTTSCGNMLHHQVYHLMMSNSPAGVPPARTYAAGLPPAAYCDEQQVYHLLLCCYSFLLTAKRCTTFCLCELKLAKENEVILCCVLWVVITNAGLQHLSIGLCTGQTMFVFFRCCVLAIFLCVFVTATYGCLCELKLANEKKISRTTIYT